MIVYRNTMKFGLAALAAFGLSACNDDKAEKPADTPSASDQAKAAVDKAKEEASKIGNKIEEKVEAATDKTKEVAGKIEDAVKPAIEATKDKATDLAAKVEEKVEAVKAAAATATASPDTAAATAPAAAPADKPAETAPTPAATPAPEAAATPAPAPAVAESEDNKAVQEAAKEGGLVFKDRRYRDKDGHPAPVVTKDYKVDWATWQGFRRYHDACHVCHGPNALGSTFAPSLGDSLKTMDYETFFGTVVGGRITDRGGTKYVMPAFGEDKNIMCYLDDIYTYIKARSLNMVDPKQGMPAGRPNGREDISPEAKKAAADCTG